jgi:pentatricopeptide repeat protein
MYATSLGKSLKVIPSTHRKATEIIPATLNGNFPIEEGLTQIVRDKEQLRNLNQMESKKILQSLIVSPNSRCLLEEMWVALVAAEIQDSPMYAFIFDEMVRARLEGDREWPVRMLTLLPNMKNSYSAVFAAWSRMETEESEFIDWIRLMQLSPDTSVLESTWNRLLSYYCRLRQRHLAWKMFDYIITSGRLRVRIGCYFLEIVKHKRREFNKVFHSLLQLDVKRWDQFSCQSIMNTVCDVYRFKKAIELLEFYRQHGKDDLSVYVMLIMKLTKRGFLIDANLVLEQLLEKKYLWNRETWFVIANFYATAGREAEYEQALNYIQTHFGLTTELYGLQMKKICKSALSNEKKAETLQSCFDDMKWNGIASNEVIMNMLVQSFGDMGYLSLVRKTIDFHREQGIEIRITTIEIMLRSRIKTKNADINDILALMDEHKLVPRSLTHSLILERYTIGPRAKLMEYYHSLRENQIRPTFDVMLKVLIALSEMNDWDSFAIVSRHLIVNPKYNLTRKEDLDLIAYGYRAGQKVSAMKLFWENRLSKRVLLPSTFAHVIHCFLDTDMSVDIPGVWAVAQELKMRSADLSLGMIQYWITNRRSVDLQNHFDELAVNGVVEHPICTTILSLSFLDPDFKWKVYLYTKTHHVLSEADFVAAFGQQLPERLEVVLMDYQKQGYKLQPNVMKQLKPLLDVNPEIKTLIEMQYAFESLPNVH